mmetsp:Transcript_14465/g.18368  ORF Transcript_14465/g.18368 Transcript_14465/m.18368 type:complete len:213 (-) Transcript_14465:643-1281(-)
MGAGASHGSCADFSEILDDHSLFLSSHHPARDLKILQRYGITHIVAITHLEAVHFPGKFEYKHLELTDSRNSTLLDYFEDVNVWIDECRANGGRVLVHCEAGMSRSASIVMGYLLGTTDESIKMSSVKEAYLFTKQKRDVVRPNYGFMNQVQSFSEGVLKNETEPLFFAEYVIEVMQLQKEGVTPELLAPLLEEHKEDFCEALRIAIENANK